MLCQHIMFFRKAVAVPGTIVRYEEHPEENGGKTMYAPVVSFSFQGQTREVTGKFSTGSLSKGVGTICKVGINPKTQEARIYSLGMTLLFFFALMLGGVVCFLLFVFFSPEPTKIFLFISPRTFVTVFMCFLAIVLLAPGGVGCYLLYSRTTFFKKAIIVPGTIVRQDEHVEYNSDGHGKSAMYTNVISYSFDGTTREIKSNFSSSHPDSSSVGKTVQVGVNPQNPYEVHIYSNGEFWLAIGLICFSSLFLIFLILKILF